MSRTRVLFMLVCAAMLSMGFISNRPVMAQSASDAGTPESGTPEAGNPEQKVWFVIAPDGKSNGDYFDVELKPGESATLSGVIGNGSDIPVDTIIYAADAYSGTNGGFILRASDEPITAPTTEDSSSVGSHICSCFWNGSPPASGR